MKTVKSILFFAAFFLFNCAHADAYKCLKDGRPVYQGSPCEVNTNKGKLDIKDQTPEEKALALEKLQEIRREYDASQAAKPRAPNQNPAPNPVMQPQAPAEMQPTDQSPE